MSTRSLRAAWAALLTLLGLFGAGAAAGVVCEATAPAVHPHVVLERAHDQRRGYRVLASAIDVFVPKAQAFPYGTMIQPAATAMNVTSLSSVLNTGGSSYGLGTSIGCPVTATLYQNGSIVLSGLTVVACTSTTFQLTIPPLAAGLYDLFFAGAGGSWVFNPGQLSVTTANNPSTIVGAILRADWPAKSNYCGGTSACTTTGQTITSIVDTSGNGNTCVPVGSPTVDMNSPYSRMPNIQTMVFSAASSQYCSVSSFSLGTTNKLYVMGAYFVRGTTGANQALSATASGAQEFYVAGSTGYAAAYNNGGGLTLTDSSASRYSTNIVYYGGVDASGSNYVPLLNVNATGALTTSGGSSPSIPNNSAFAMGAVPGGGSYFNGEICEEIVMNAAPTSTQLSQLYSYFNGSCGMVGPPVFVGMTTVQAMTANAPANIAMTGVMGTPTVAANIGGTSTPLTVVASGSTWIQVQVPSTAVGTYDITVTNPIGAGATQANAMSVSAGTPTPEMCLGANLIAWSEGVPTCNGSPCLGGSLVSAWPDLSQLGNTWVQATGADQPLVNSLADSNFNGYPSLSFGGSPQQMQIASWTIPGTPTATYAWMVARLGSLGIQVLFDFTIAGSVQVQYNTSAGVREVYSSTTAPYGVLTTALTHFLVGRTSGSGTATLGMNVDNGTEATNTVSATPAYGSPSTSYLGSSGGSNYGTFTIAMIAVSGGTSPNISCMNTYVQKFGAGLNISGERPANDNGRFVAMGLSALAVAVRRRKAVKRAA